MKSNKLVASFFILIFSTMLRAQVIQLSGQVDPNLKLSVLMAETATAGPKALCYHHDIMNGWRPKTREKKLPVSVTQDGTYSVKMDLRKETSVCGWQKYAHFMINQNENSEEVLFIYVGKSNLPQFS